MILIVDNYDSFTYNLYQYIGELVGGKEEIKVVRNNEITVEEVGQYTLSHIIISPGPKYPKDAGICMELVQKLGGKVPILGVCLGHQVIGEAFGGHVGPAKEVLHGKATPILVDVECTLFRNLPTQILGGRYHSLIVENESLPSSLKVVARDARGEIMGIAHRDYRVYGIQFHPESILTPDGKKIIANFLEVA